MKTMYDNYFEFLYRAAFDSDSFPVEKVKRALAVFNEGKKKGNQVEWHAFHLHLMLWRELNVCIDVHAVKFPLPPMDMFIPSQNVEWNLSKGPSDTLTKLFDDSEENITIRTPQTIAVARFLSVSATAFHRSLQITNAREDVEFYQTLDNYRRAANNRSTFKKSLGKLAGFLRTEMESILEDEAKKNAAAMTGRPPLQRLPSSPQQRRTRNNTAIPTQQWNEKWQSGNTPTKAPGRPTRQENRNKEYHRQRREDCLGVVICSNANGNRSPCELCGTSTFFYCSGCSSALCFQVGNNIMSDKKEKAIRKHLKLPASIEIPKYNKFSSYHPGTGERKEVRVLNSCYHIAHGRKFTSFFANDGENNTTTVSDDEQNGDDDNE